MERTIEIRTRRYSTFVHRILDEYTNILINIDGAIYHDKDIPYLKEFFANRQLKATLDFLVTREDKALFGFHDYPSGFFWANISEIEFIKKLAEEKIIHYRILPVRPSFWQRFFR
ncbi:MAG: hypothetical protein ISS71_01895 [Phycisphaerae bacterium]|nr:hypothetical protein [Phycisphaerae bacterium]